MMKKLALLLFLCLAARVFAADGEATNVQIPQTDANGRRQFIDILGSSNTWQPIGLNGAGVIGAYTILEYLNGSGEQITTTQIANRTITDSDISDTAGIANSKLLTNPLARANHTGTQAWSTITSTPTTLAGYGITDGASGNFAVVVQNDNGTRTTYLPTADTDAARGTALITAVAAALAGDVILVGPGNYETGTTQLVLPTGSSLIGYGWGTSIITGQKRVNNIKLATGVTIQGLKIVVVTPSSSSGHSILGNESAAYTNATIRDCHLVGEQDIFNDWGAFGSTSIRVVNSILESKSDVFNHGAGTGNTVEIQGCTVLADGATNPDPSAGLAGLAATTGVTLNVRSTRVIMGNAGAGGAGSAIITTGTGVANVQDCWISVNSGGYDLYASAGTINVSGGRGSGTNGAYLTSGTITNLGADYARFGDSIDSSEITDATVALADMANLVQSSLIGRATASTGAPERIAIGSDFTASGSPPTLALANSYATTSAPSLVGVGTIGGTWKDTAAPMAALAIDWTKLRNTKTLAADSTVTLSGSPSDGQYCGVAVTNTDTASHTITLPAGIRRVNSTTEVTSLTVGAAAGGYNGYLEFYLRKVGTEIILYDGAGGSGGSGGLLAGSFTGSATYTAGYIYTGAMGANASLTVSLSDGERCAFNLNVAGGPLILSFSPSAVRSGASGSIPSLNLENGNQWVTFYKAGGTLYVQPDIYERTDLSGGDVTGVLGQSNGGTGVAALATGIPTWFGSPSSANLRAATTDETGTGGLVFAGGDIGAATATTPSAADNDTSVPTTAFVQGELTTRFGTATATPQAGINALLAASGALSQGDVFYYNGTNIVRLGPGTSGQVLTTAGEAANPFWTTVSGSGNNATSILQFYSSLSSATAVTNLPSAAALLTPSSTVGTFQVDLTNALSARIVIRTDSVAAAAGSKLILRYATTNTSTVGSYSDIGTSEVSVSPTAGSTAYASSWITLAAGAKANVFVAVVVSGGDGVVDPSFSQIRMEYK